MIYLLDTNVIADITNPVPNQTVLLHLRNHRQNNTICLCEPVIYEVERGWKHRRAEKKLQQFRQQVFPQFNIVPVQLVDWRAAAVLWADARRRGYQLSDVDLLIAAMALRLNATIVTADDDFAILPIIRANWQNP